MYMISRLDHSPVLFLMMKPTSPPTNTPITVAMVRTFSCMNDLNLPPSCLGRVMVTVRVWRTLDPAGNPPHALSRAITSRFVAQADPLPPKYPIR